MTKVLCIFCLGTHYTCTHHTILTNQTAGYNVPFTNIEHYVPVRFNPLPNEKFLAWSKFKADDKITVTEKLEFLFRRVENIVGKRENAGNLSSWRLLGL